MVVTAFSKIHDIMTTSRKARWGIVAAWSILICSFFLLNGPMPYERLFDGDYDVISMVGRRVAAGDVLYVDAYEQKGPLVYWLWALFWTIGQGYTGVAICAWIFATAMFVLTAVFLSETLAIAGGSRRLGWFLLALPFSMGCVIGRIQMPGTEIGETFMLPMLACSALILARTMYGDKQSFPTWIFCGIGVAIAFFTKYPGTILFAIMLITILWVGVRKQVNLMPYVGWAFASALIVASLVVFALMISGSLSGFIDLYVAGNLSGYSTFINSVQDHDLGTFFQALGAGILFAPVRFLSLFYVWFHVLKSRSRCKKAFIFLCVTFTLYGLIRCWPTYNLCWIVFIPFAMSWFTCPSWLEGKATQTCLAMVIVMLAVEAGPVGFYRNQTLTLEENRELVAQMPAETDGSVSLLVYDFELTFLYDEYGAESFFALPVKVNCSYPDDELFAKAIKERKIKYVVMSMKSRLSYYYDDIYDDLLEPAGYIPIYGENSAIIFKLDSAYEDDCVLNDPTRIPGGANGRQSWCQWTPDAPAII